MGDKSGLCLWCGRWTELKASDGLADCDRPECIAKREPYWWTFGDETWIETWRGEPKPENVVRLARVHSLDDADALIEELNGLAKKAILGETQVHEVIGSDACRSCRR